MARIGTLIPMPIEVQLQPRNLRGERLHMTAGRRQLARQQPGRVSSRSEPITVDKAAMWCWKRRRILRR